MLDLLDRDFKSTLINTSKTKENNVHRTNYETVSSQIVYIIKKIKIIKNEHKF